MNDSDTKKAIKEAIDACRPGADDVSLPEMSALADSLREDEQVRWWYERTQRSDAAIGHAFRDIPIPEGLSDRLVAAVHNEGKECGQAPSSFVAEAVREQCDLNQGADVAEPAARSKRRKHMAIAGFSLAVICLACLPFILPGNTDITPDRLSRDVNEWMDEVAEANDWNANLAEAPDQNYPRGAAIRAVPRQWRVAKTRYDSRATVYDIRRGGGGFAYVFCIRAKGRNFGLPAVPPTGPQWTTGGVAVGAWQQKGMVYILAVEGGKRQYRGYLGHGVELTGESREDGPLVCPTRRV